LSVVSDGADTEVCMGHAIGEAVSPDDVDDAVDSSLESESESHSSRGLKSFLRRVGLRMRRTRPVLKHGGQW
jgi:hypothetical protein